MNHKSGGLRERGGVFVLGLCFYIVIYIVIYIFKTAFLLQCTFFPLYLLCNLHCILRCMHVAICMVSFRHCKDTPAILAG